MLSVIRIILFLTLAHKFSHIGGYFEQHFEKIKSFANLVDHFLGLIIGRYRLFSETHLLSALSAGEKCLWKLFLSYAKGEITPIHDFLNCIMSKAAKEMHDSTEESMTAALQAVNNPQSCQHSQNTMFCSPG